MTPVGHTLIGATIGLVTVPHSYSPKQKAILIPVFGVIANLPDFKLPMWGHARYDISHSIFSLLIVISLAWLFFSIFSNLLQKIGGYRVFAGASCACLSHLVLDSMYGHGYGVKIGWPFGEFRLNMPLPWFDVLDIQKGLPYIARVFFVELFFYGWIIMAVLMLTSRWKKGK